MPFRRPSRGSPRLQGVLEIEPPFGPPRLGGLCQARLWWPSAGVALSGALHPSRGHFKPSLAGLRTRARHFPLEELRPRWKARPDGPCRHGVLTTLLSARAPQRVLAHPSLQVSRESLARF